MLGQRGNDADTPADRPQGKDRRVSSSSTGSKISSQLLAKDAKNNCPSLVRVKFFICPVHSKPYSCQSIERRLRPPLDKTEPYGVGIKSK